MDYLFDNGDILKTRSAWPGAWHFAIVLNDGPNQNVIHNMPDTGPVIEPLTKFLNERQVEEILKSSLNQQTPDELKRRFLNFRGERFDMIFNNCEIFVNKMLGLPENSQQVDIWLFTIAAICLIFIIS